MANTVLVAYASKHGSTAAIAAKIGSVLEQYGLESETRIVDGIQDLSGYDAVVLGSAVYAGQWRREAIRFLEQRESELTELPVWLFSSGPTGEGEPIELLQGWRFPEAQQPIADRIDPRDIAVFPGALDWDELNMAEKVIVRGVKAPLGDFRDWDAIVDWAEGIAQAIMQANPQPV